MGSMDDFLEKISMQMHDQEVADLEADLEERMARWEAANDRLLVMIALLGLHYWIYAQVDPLMESSDSGAVASIPHTPDVTASYRIIDDDLQRALAKAFKHVEGLQQVEGVDLGERVERLTGGSLPEAHVSMLMLARFDPGSLAIRGLMQVANPGSTDYDRMLQVDLLPEFYNPTK